MQYAIKDDCSRTRGAQISAIIEALAETVGTPEYRILFKRPITLTFTDARLKLGASNLFTTSWIKDHFLNEISLAIRVVIKRLLSKPGTRRLDPKNINSLEEKDMK